MNSWTSLQNNGKKLPPRVKRVKPKKKAPVGLCIVYGLAGADGVVRYVGQTRTDLETRLNYHKRNAFTGGGSPCAHWIAENKGDITITALDDNATWNVSEILIIDSYRRKGHHLWNVTRGGDDTLADVKREGCYPASHKAIQIERMKERAIALGIEPVQPTKLDTQRLGF